MTTLLTALHAYAIPAFRRALPTSGCCALELDGQPLAASDPAWVLRATREITERSGCREVVVVLDHLQLHVELEHHTAMYDGTALCEVWFSLRNTGDQMVRITRLDSLVLDLPADSYTLHAFTSSWGWEYEPHRQVLEGDYTLESRSGRSSHGHVPWFALESPQAGMLSGAVAWSGNWVVRFAHRADGGYTLSGGLHDWAFASELAPGATISAVPFVLASTDGSDLNAISRQYALVGRRFWYPHNALADRLPVEWNHWWSYVDHAINEATFRANVDAAARLGIEVCTLDAGWFGAADPAIDWYQTRGDWDVINTERFPSGLRALSDYVHSRGMAFGLWCEIEGLGKRARLAETHPQLVAQRDGEPLGYVCLGSAAGQAWAFALLERLIQEYRCDWIKLDFNLDPGAGCNRTDHGHAAGDGLYAHYRGYYALLEQVRARYPHVVLENCSSGGLRIDLGIARQTHMAFLSDPDWPEHSLQTFWGATTMLGPDACLHWGYCEWSFTEHRHQHFAPRDPALQPHQLDYYTRISMLRRFGFSQRLPELPDWVVERYREHIATYNAHVRRFVRAATFLRLTEQPLREGRGERWAAFQYHMPDGSADLLAVFRLPGATPERTIRLQALNPERTYTLTWLNENRTATVRGADLMASGLQITDLPEEGSALVLLR